MINRPSTVIRDLVTDMTTSSQNYSVPSRPLASAKLSCKTYCNSASSESKEGKATGRWFVVSLADSREREGCRSCTAREPVVRLDVGGWCPLWLEIDKDERATSLQLLCPAVEVIAWDNELTLLLARDDVDDAHVEARGGVDDGIQSSMDAGTLRLQPTTFPKDGDPPWDGWDGVCQTLDLPMLSGDIDKPTFFKPASMGSGF